MACSIPFKSLALAAALGLGLTGGASAATQAVSSYRDYAAATSTAQTLEGSEKVAELYYRWRIAKQFELSPSLQIISKPGGSASAADVRIVGLRSQFTF